MNDQIDALKALQMALARLGYYTGAIDGLFGPRTDAALKAVAAEGGAIRNPTFVQAVLGGVAQSAQPNVNLAEIGRFRIPNVPLPAQRAIAATLGALDDKIELNRRMNETLEAMARALFRDWFVDFGPTRAKMAGTAPYLSPDLWPLFPDRLNDEGKPEGWESKGLLRLANLISGGTPKTNNAEFWNGNIPWASAKDVSQCKDAFLIETERSISESGLKNSATKIIPKYATVIVARGATTALAHD